jgi:hypothetical protein
LNSRQATTNTFRMTIVHHPDPALAFVTGSSDGNDVRALGPLEHIGAISRSGEAAAFSDVPLGLEVG